MFVITNKLGNNFVCFWEKKKFESKPRLAFYRTVSSAFVIQPYLLLSEKDLNHRRALAIDMIRLRISAHDLAIERGRYINTPHSDRLCKKCNVLDEIHFFDNCVIYTETSKRWIDIYHTVK